MQQIELAAVLFPGGGQSKQRGLAGAFKVAARRIFLVVVRKNARHDVCGFSSASFPVNRTTDVGLCFAAMVRPATVMSNGGLGLQQERRPSTWI